LRRDPLAPGPVLDNPAWHALVGPHATVAERVGGAARYPVDVSPFGALADGAGEDAWNDAARLPGAHDLVLVQPPSPPPPGWEILGKAPGIQMVAPDLAGAPDDEAVVLGGGDVADMLALIERTKPGPFRPRTIELGTYLGVRRDGVLVAMAGERLRLPGWTEVSAVCTDAHLRGTGMATRLVLAVVAGIRARGDRALLHVASNNTNAIRLYRQLGFVDRLELDFMIVRAPQSGAAGGPRS